MHDNPTTVNLAIASIQDLQQKLKGYGSPPITASANPELREWLSALRNTIDEFLET